MIIFAWILLGLAAVDVVFAVVQLTVLSGMRLIVDDMKPLVAWLVVVGPSVVVLMLANLSLNISTQIHPRASLAALVAVYVVLGIVVLFQAAATKPILQHEKDTHNQRLKRMADWGG